MPLMNKMNIRKLRLFVVLLLPLFAVGCLKEDPSNQTLVLFGEEGYVKDFEEVFGRPAHESMNVNLDIYPPDVRGEFEFANRECVYPSGIGNPDDKVYFRFGGDFTHWNDYMHGQQHLITHCDVLIPGLDLNSEQFHADTAYVKGNGDQFVVYLQRKQLVRVPLGNKFLRYWLTQGIAISGRRTDGHSNITNARLALYNIDIKIDNPGEFEAEVLEAVNSMKGKLFVYKDSDDTTRYNTNSNQPFVNWDN
jgi:hypothetical protein